MASDDSSKVAFDPAAPAGERFDAMSSLSQIYRPGVNSIIPPEDLQPALEFIQNSLEEERILKAQNVIQFPARGNPAPKQGMQSVYIDQQQIMVSGEYYEKPTAINFDALRNMSEQTPILAAVIQTRIRQVNRFCQISEDGGPGFEIRHIDRKHKMSGDEDDAAKLVGQFISNCGWEFNPRKRKALKRDNFPQFMAKSIRDSLALDSCPIETEMKRSKDLGIDGFYAVDGATIRLCTEQGYEGDDEIYALQVIQQRIVAAYDREHLIYEVRNPRTDVRLAGYGLAEPEMMVRVITGFLNALTYNISGFDQNALPKGLLTLMGEYGKEDLIAFRRFWNSTVKGINNAWALPVMVAKDSDAKAQFERFDDGFNEMHFANWMTLLTSIICAIYGMDPAEINFESFAANKSSLSGSDTAEKLSTAQDKGLRPFMAFYEGMISDYIVSAFSDKLCFRWTGLDEDDGVLTESQKLLLTVNEARAERGYQPWKSDGDGPDIGEAPMNPDLISVWQAATMPQPGEEFGGPKAEDQMDFGTTDDDPEQPGSNGEEQTTRPHAGRQAVGNDSNPTKSAAGGGKRTKEAPTGRTGGSFGKAVDTFIYSVGQD